jgi:hypothetical protein
MLKYFVLLQNTLSWHKTVTDKSTNFSRYTSVCVFDTFRRLICVCKRRRLCWLLMLRPKLYSGLKNATGSTVLHTTRPWNFFKKPFPFLKVFKNIFALQMFQLHGHHQVLQSSYGENCCISVVVAQVCFAFRTHLWAGVSHSNGPFFLCVTCVLLWEF